MGNNTLIFHLFAPSASQSLLQSFPLNISIAEHTDPVAVLRPFVQLDQHLAAGQLGQCFWPNVSMC